MTSNHNKRVAIVGAGPIGLETAVAVQRQGCDVIVLDAGSLGHTMSWWAPQTRWFSSNERISIAGVPLLTIDQSKATREEYLTYLRGVASQFSIPIRTHTPVIDVKRGEGQLTLVAKPAPGREDVSADAVVLAIGGTDFPRKLNLPGEDLPHVDGYLRETHRYFGRRVLIIGGRNSAIEAALRLHHVGAKVSLCYRQESLPEHGIKYWLLPEIKGLLKSGRIESYLGTRPAEILPDSVIVERVSDGSTHKIPADDVLSLIGYEQDKSLMRAAGVELVGENLRPRYNEETMETNVPGIYVAGTAVAGTQTSKYKTFLENCHDHADRIAAHVTGRTADSQPRQYASEIVVMPES